MNHEMLDFHRVLTAEFVSGAGCPILRTFTAKVLLIDHLCSK